MPDTELSEQDRSALTSWAVTFSSLRPSDGIFVSEIIDRAGQIPVNSIAARDFAREYFKQKLAMAIVRERHLAGQPDAVVQRMGGSSYWRSVIDWFGDGS